MLLTMYCSFFFFQAEDGIRDIGVTGVQTCALPIFSKSGDRKEKILICGIDDAVFGRSLDYDQ